MNNVQAVLTARRKELVAELEIIEKFLALSNPGNGKVKAKAAGNGGSSARSEAMRRAWARRRKEATAAPVAKKSKKVTAGASLADVA